MNDIAKRITQARTRAELSKSALARKLGITPQSVQDWEAGATAPRAERLNELAAILDVPVHWLAFGEGEPRTLADKNGDYIAVPLLEATTSAGYGDTVSNAAIRLVELSKAWLRKILSSLNFSSLRLYPVRGDSMAPTILNGDTIMIDISTSELSDDGIYALRIDDSLFVKRIQRFPGHKYRVISDNPRYEPFELAESDSFEVIGRVVYFWHGEVC